MKNKETINCASFKKAAEMFSSPIIWCGCNEKGYYWKYWEKWLKLNKKYFS